MERVVLIVLVALASLGVGAQNIVPSSAGSVGAGCVMSAAMVSAVEGANPATNALAEGLSVAVGGVIPFALVELKEIGLVATGVTKVASVTARVGQTGDGDSHFTTFGGGLSRMFGCRFSLGVEYYGLVHKVTYADAGRSSFSSIGLVVFPSERWLFSVAVRNIERREIRYASRTVVNPRVLWSALRWSAPRYFTLVFEGEKREDEAFIGKGAVVVRPTECLLFTAGYSYEGRQFSAGVGYDWSVVGFRCGVAHHEQLGVTSGATLALHIKWDE